MYQIAADLRDVTEFWQMSNVEYLQFFLLMDISVIICVQLYTNVCYYAENSKEPKTSLDKLCLSKSGTYRKFGERKLLLSLFWGRL